MENLINNYIDANSALERLKKGNINFFNNSSKHIDISNERRSILKQGQTPFAIILSCSDSRITPAHIFNVGIGDIFEIRVAGNVLDFHSFASIEYALTVLNVKLILVLGHENCGAVSAAYDKLYNKAKFTGNLDILTNKIITNIKHSKSIECASIENIQNSVKEISQNPIIKTMIENQDVLVVGAKYTLDGKVLFNI